jgi:anti-anti-sigma factor
MTSQPPDDALDRLCDMKVEHAGAVARVEFHGEFDLSCADLFAELVDPIVAERLVLDLSTLSFIDSSALRMILRTQERARQEGFILEVVRGSGQVDKVMRVTGLAESLPLVDPPSPNGTG